MKMKVIIHERSGTGQSRVPQFAVDSNIEVVNTAEYSASTNWKLLFTNCVLYGIHASESDSETAFSRALPFLSEQCFLLKYTDDWLGCQKVESEGRTIWKVSHRAVERNLPAFVKHHLETGRWEFKILCSDAFAELSRAIHGIENLLLPIRLDTASLDRMIRESPPDAPAMFDSIWLDYFARADVRSGEGYLGLGREFGTRSRDCPSTSIEAEIAYWLNSIKPFRESIAGKRSKHKAVLLSLVLDETSDLVVAISKEMRLPEVRKNGPKIRRSRDATSLKELLELLLSPLAALNEELRQIRTKLQKGEKKL